MSVSFFLVSLPIISFQKIQQDSSQIDDILQQDCTKRASLEYNAQQDLDGLSEFGIDFQHYISTEIGEYQFYHVYRVDELIERLNNFLKTDEDELYDYWTEQKAKDMMDLVTDRILPVLKNASRLDQYLVTYWG